MEIKMKHPVLPDTEAIKVNGIWFHRSIDPRRDEYEWGQILIEAGERKFKPEEAAPYPPASW